MCDKCFKHANVVIDISNESYVKELSDMLEEKQPVKEINIKIEKIGVIHYIGMTYPKEAVTKPETCEDCGEKVNQYTKVMGGKRDEKGKPVWKSICNKCLEAYKSKDLDMPVTTKLGEYKGQPVSSTTKPYTPYNRQCNHCAKLFDLHHNTMYNVITKPDIKTYCRNCFIKVIGITPEEVSL